MLSIGQDYFNERKITQEEQRFKYPTSKLKKKELSFHSKKITRKIQAKREIGTQNGYIRTEL